MGLWWRVWDYGGGYGTMVEGMGLWWRVWDYGGGYGTMVESMEVKKGGGVSIIHCVKNDNFY